jgi:hypothetical protein
MAKRSGRVHVATTRRKYKGKVYETHLLRRTYREGDKVRNETLGNISHLPPDLIDVIRRALKGETFVPAQESFEIISTRQHGHVAAVLGALKLFGLDKIIDPKPSPQRQRVLAMIAMRILDPGSKLYTTRAWNRTTLPEELGLGKIDEDDLYEAMDWLLERQSKIETALAKRHLKGSRLLLYDLTSTYFEGRCCPLAARGHNRDGKKGKLQVNFGLMANDEGCPVAVDVFEGNVGDPKTLKSQVQKTRERFGMERVVWVGDRGMITSARIREDLRPEDGIDWISALRAPAIQKLREGGAIQLSFFDERDLAEITDPSYPGERLVVCRNPLLAEERSRKRKDLLQATEKQLEKIRVRVQSGRLKKKAKIGIAVGKVIGKYKVGKLFNLKIGDKSFQFSRNSERIEREAALDGLYVIRTSVPKQSMTPEAVVLAYKSLSEAERAFRTIKTVGEKVRPVYHYSADRVRAHIFLCVLAYYVQWHLERAWAPLLFRDELRGLLDRASPVAPAPRSESAKRKERTKRRPDGEPVHSFATLLGELGTLARNRLRPKGQETQAAPGADDPSPKQAEFDLLTHPSKLQREAFELLGLKLPV